MELAHGGELAHGWFLDFILVLGHFWVLDHPRLKKPYPCKKPQQYNAAGKKGIKRPEHGLFAIFR